MHERVRLLIIALKARVPWLIVGGVLLFVLFYGVWNKVSIVPHVGPATLLQEEHAVSLRSFDDCRNDIPLKDAGSFFDRTNCYGETLRSWIFAGKNITEAMQYLEQDAKAHPEDNVVNGQCHLLAHKISQAAFWKYDKNVGYILRQCSPISCASNGCYHGALIEWTLTTPDFLAKLDEVCREPSDNPYTSTEKINCYHGLGHGIMQWLKNELPEALEKCGIISDASGREFCIHGMFHENSLADLEHPSKYIDPKRPLYPCADIPEKYRTLCYNAVGANVIKFAGSSQAAFQLCDTVPELQYAEVCYRSVANILAEPGADPEKLIATCETEGKRFRQTCLQTMLSGILTNNPHAENTAARTFCESLAEHEQASCYGQIRHAIESAHPSETAQGELRQLCGAAGSYFSDICP